MSATSSSRAWWSASSGNTSGCFAPSIERGPRRPRCDDLARAPDAFGERAGNSRHVNRRTRVEQDRRQSRGIGGAISQNAFQPLGIRRRLSPLQLSYVLDAETEPLRIDLPASHGAVLHLPDVGYALRGDLVHTHAAVDDEGVFGAEPHEGLV